MSMTCKKMTESGQVFTGFCTIKCIVLLGGDDTATLDVYDGTSPFDNHIHSMKAPAGENRHFEPAFALQCHKGAYITLSGTNPVCFIYYA